MSRAQMNTNKRRGAAQMHSTPSFTYSAFLHLPQLSGPNLLSYMTDGLFQLSKTLLELLKNADPEVKAQLRLALLT